MHSIRKIVIICSALFLVLSCKKENVQPDALKNTALHNGILVLNEGLMNQNNSSLSWVDLSNNTVTPNVFLAKNNRLLGDTGNDMLAYGGKIYITVTGSSTVEVIQRATLKSLQQIPFTFGGQPQEPRELTKGAGKIFVSSFDGYVSVIDTTSLKITHRIKVGRNPEGICFKNNSLYVANSGGLDAPNYDSTVMKIDVGTLSIVDTFTVGTNPGNIVADDYDHVYVVKQGDNTSASSTLIRINIQDGVITDLGKSCTSLSIKNNILYLSYYDFSSGTSTVSTYDCASQSFTPSIISNQLITTLYGVQPLDNGDIVCIDAMNFTNSGYLRIFSPDGHLIENSNVGLNPTSIIYYEKN